MLKILSIQYTNTFKAFWDFLAFLDPEHFVNKQADMGLNSPDESVFRVSQFTG